MTLVPLSRRTEARLSEDAYDVRGWEVRTEADDGKVGKVDDIVVDREGAPRLLDVDFGTFKKHILVPLEWARADRENETVWVERLDRDRLQEIPEYDREGDTLSVDYVARLKEQYDHISGRARASEVERSRGDLARMGDLGEYRVSKTSADPRGWTVVAGDGGKVGEVVELIVDTASMKARYLDVRVDEKKLELEPLDRHVLIPVDRARLEGKDKRVRVDRLFAEDVGRYPVYRGLPLDQNAEREIEDAFWTRRDEGGGRWSRTRSGFFRGSPDRGGSRTAPRAERVEVGAEKGELRVPEQRPHGRAETDAERQVDVEPVQGEPRGDRESHRTTTVGDGEETRVKTDSGEVRIRVTGDDIIVEKHPAKGE